MEKENTRTDRQEEKQRMDEIRRDGEKDAEDRLRSREREADKIETDTEN